jgi:hypothetical protein
VLPFVWSPKCLDQYLLQIFFVPDPIFINNFLDCCQECGEPVHAEAVELFGSHNEITLFLNLCSMIQSKHNQVLEFRTVMMASGSPDRNVVECDEVMTKNLELFNQMSGSSLAKEGMTLNMRQANHNEKKIAYA